MQKAAMGELAEQLQKHEAAEAEVANLRKAVDKAQIDLTEEQTRHQSTTERLHHEITAHAMVTQQVTDLADRLRAEEGHRQSLEEKHTQARQALEHFRAATKEQREQELRQHEQQIQYLQGEVQTIRNSLIQAQQGAVTSNLENARLTSELSRSERALHDARAEVRSFKDVKAELEAAQQQLERLGRRVVELDAQAAAANAVNEQLEAGRIQDREEIRQLQINLTAARTAAETQDQLAERIQAWMAKPDSAAAGGVNRA